MLTIFCAKATATVRYKSCCATQQISAWTDQLRAAVDGQLRHQIAVSDIKGSRLIIHCRSAGIATKMRFLAPDLIPKLNTLSAFSRIDELVLKVLSANTET